MTYEEFKRLKKDFEARQTKAREAAQAKTQARRQAAQRAFQARLGAHRKRETAHRVGLAEFEAGRPELGGGPVRITGIPGEDPMIDVPKGVDPEEVRRAIMETEQAHQARYGSSLFSPEARRSPTWQGEIEEAIALARERSKGPSEFEQGLAEWQRQLAEVQAQKPTGPAAVTPVQPQLEAMPEEFFRVQPGARGEELGEFLGETPRYAAPYLREWGQTVGGYNLPANATEQDITKVLQDLATRHQVRGELPMGSAAARDYFGNLMRDLMEKRVQTARPGTQQVLRRDIAGLGAPVTSFLQQQLGVQQPKDFDVLFKTLGRQYGGGLGF